MNDTKVLVLDIDGTLTNSQKEISPATKRGILETIKRGHKVILASGRPTPGMRRYESELELQKYGGYIRRHCERLSVGAVFYRDHAAECG